jgi:molybdopterin-guanine dinucleotide biosynthesis protein A
MNSSCAVILLAGGLASRLGSDKALQPLAGKPLAIRIIERLPDVYQELFVVIARNSLRSEYTAVLPEFVQVINDEPEGKSPLVGITTGLRATKSQFAVVLSCDIPFVSGNVIRLLLDRALNADAAIPRSREGHLEPLQAVYRRQSMLRQAEQALSRGQLSPLDAIKNLTRVAYVSIEDELKRIDPGLRTFFNVNTQEDVAVAEAILLRELNDKNRVDAHIGSPGSHRFGKVL